MTATTVTETALPLGTVVVGRCVTNYTEHQGELIGAVPDAFYSNGAVRGYRYTIRDSVTGRPVVLWTGTERE